MGPVHHEGGVVPAPNLVVVGALAETQARAPDWAPGDLLRADRMRGSAALLVGESSCACASVVRAQRGPHSRGEGRAALEIACPQIDG